MPFIRDMPRGLALLLGALATGLALAQTAAPASAPAPGPVPAPRSPACRDALAALQADENRLLQEQRGRGAPAGAPPARERLRPARERAA
ncbi:MAG: serine protease, partial [Burkholderiales bacterium]|nr:serine protease [Burkholderiales bacterium]